jgi:putative redox protein
LDLITITRRNGLEFSAHLRGHQVTTDMSREEGGLDGAPNPVELLGCSLGSCIATMLQGYCNEQGYTDGDVGVSLTLELADDPKRIAGFVIDVELPQDWPEEMRDEAKRIVEAFPVPGTLRIAPRVDIDFL